MIIYNGISLESVAPVRIEDIRVSPIELNPITRPRAIAGGSEFVRMRDGTRTVAITFAVLDDNRSSRQNALMRISEWAKSDKEYRLDLPNYPGLYLMAVCTGKPEPSLRQWWESKLRLVFTCYDSPYWISNTEKVVNCGTAFYALGDAPPLMWLTRSPSSSVSNAQYSDGTDTIKFSTIPAGDLVIDLNRQTAAVSGTSIMQYYKVDSSWINPKTGSQTITGTGKVHYRERWN